VITTIIPVTPDLDKHQSLIVNIAYSLTGIAGKQVTGVRYLDVLLHHFTKCVIDIELQNKSQKIQAKDFGALTQSLSGDKVCYYGQHYTTDTTLKPYQLSVYYTLCTYEPFRH